MSKKEEHWSKYLFLGSEMAISVFLFAFIGYKADSFFKISPIGVVIGVILGGSVGIWNIFKIAQNIR